MDLAFRILQAGYRITFQPGAIVYHQNQPDLRGLFREGFAHGFHSVKTLKKHRAFLRQYGHRWPSMRSYVSLGTNLVKVAGRRASPEMLYDTVFNLGKKAGKVLGSLRFGYPGL